MPLALGFMALIVAHLVAGWLGDWIALFWTISPIGAAFLVCYPLLRFNHMDNSIRFIGAISGLAVVAVPSSIHFAPQTNIGLAQDRPITMKELFTLWGVFLPLNFLLGGLCGPLAHSFKSRFQKADSRSNSRGNSPR